MPHRLALLKAEARALIDAAPEHCCSQGDALTEAVSQAIEYADQLRTASRQLKSELDALDTALKDLYSVAPVALVELQNGLLHRWNERAQLLLETVKRPYKGQGFTSFFARESHGAYFDALRSAEAEQSEKSCTLLLHAENEVSQCVQLVFRSSQTKPGTCWVGLQDVSEQRRQAAELLRANRALREITDTRESFLRGIAHDLRTPLNAIQGSLDLLHEEKTERADQAALATIGAAVLSMRALVSSALTVPRADRPEQAVFRPNAFAVRELLERVERILNSSRLVEAGVKLIVEMDPSVPARITTDPGMLERILLNLGENALKFTRQGAVRLLAACPAPNEVEIHVEDTGIGIPTDKLDRVFEPYVQLDDSARKMHGSQGLGLATAAALARSMSGHLGVASRVDGNRGTVFVLRIPFTPCELSADLTDDLVADARTTGARILLAEDDPVSHSICARLLRRQGYEVFDAWDGKQAIDIFERESIDVILMDLQMPVLDGSGAVFAIRELELKQGPASSVFIIGISAMSMEEVEASRLGFDSMQTKPLEFQSLRRIIEGFLRTRSQTSK